MSEWLEGEKMAESELTELDKVFLNSFLTTWKVDEQEVGKKSLLRDLGERGHIIEISSHEFRGLTTTDFKFENGGGCSYYPGMSKLRDAYPPTYTEVKA
jgi:hypothetical protein